jgi:hypothetical protein
MYTLSNRQWIKSNRLIGHAFEEVNDKIEHDKSIIVQSFLNFTRSLTDKIKIWTIINDICNNDDI